MKQIGIGYQLYSAREDAKADLARVCGELKAIGYDSVEFAGFYGKSAEEINEILAQTGLKAVSSHVPLSAFQEDLFGTIAYHQKIGCPYIAIPSLPPLSRPGAQDFASVLPFIRRVGSLCREAGIQLLYHNHDFEFVNVSGVWGLDFLYSAVEPDVLQTEIDVCWVHYAGEDPAAYLRKYAGRASLVHLKDYVGKKGSGTPYALIGQKQQADEGIPFEFRPFGFGCVDVKSIVEAGIEAGARCFIVEQDQWYDKPPMDHARKSMETLRRLGVAQA